MAAYQIFVLLCVAVLFNTAESFICHKCSSTSVADGCFNALENDMTTVSCTRLLGKCLARQTVNTRTNVTTFTRECHTNIVELGAKDGCKTENGIRTCQMVCDNKDNCNDKSSTDLEKCAANGNCAPETIHTGYTNNCYKCSGTADTCLKASDGNTPKESCHKLIQKCLIERVVDYGNNNSITFKRECSTNLLGLGAKGGCEAKENKRTCQMVCDDDLCNGLSSTELEKCAPQGNCLPPTLHTGQGFQCYTCETHSNTGQCVDAPDSSTTIETCVKGVSKCMTQSETRKGILQRVRRRCHFDLFGLGWPTKNGCKTEGGVEQCQIFCDNKNLCNSRAQSAMEKCAKEGGCKTDIQCYKCETSQETDKCFSAPDSSLGTETCLGGGKCMTQRQINKGNNDLVLFKRGCIPNIGIHVNGGCTTMNNIETCTTVCNQGNLCNNQTQTRMEKTGSGFAKSVYIMFMQMIDNNISLTINT